MPNRPGVVDWSTVVSLIVCECQAQYSPQPHDPHTQLFNVRGARTFLMASHVGVVSGTHSSYTTKPLRIAFAVALSCAANIAGICAFVWAMYDRWYMTNLCSAIGYTLAFYYAMFLMVCMGCNWLFAADARGP